MELDQWTGFLSWTCIIITLIGYTAGIPACFDIVAKKSTQSIPFLPFMLGCTANAVCLWYGILIWDRPTIVCNTTGVTLHTVYISVYFVFTSRKAHVFQLVSFTSVGLVAFYLYLNHIVVIEADIKHQLGLSLSTFILVWKLSPMLQISKVIQTKSSEGLSPHLSLAMFASSLAWTLYGHAIGNIFILIPCVPGVFSGLIQLYLLHKYPADKSVKAE